IFEKENLSQHFIHSLGHGVGLEVHELPHLRKTGKEKLLENMVFSVEPGLYFDWGGVRIEDLVVIKDGKAQVLGKTQKEMISLAV
ncbi:MAG: M24 family metallopeptidase, partial [bacterium]|nr:M24 family metallopeptidase [bacterium]